jgi:hypothetical protein
MAESFLDILRALKQNSFQIVGIIDSEHFKLEITLHSPSLQTQSQCEVISCYNVFRVHWNVRVCELLVRFDLILAIRSPSAMDLCLEVFV